MATLSMVTAMVTGIGPHHRVDLLGADAAQLALAEIGGQAVLDLEAAEPVQERADQAVARRRSAVHGFVRPSHSKNLFGINGPGRLKPG